MLPRKCKQKTTASCWEQSSLETIVSRQERHEFGTIGQDTFQDPKLLGQGEFILPPGRDEGSFLVFLGILFGLFLLGFLLGLFLLGLFLLGFFLLGFLLGLFLLGLFLLGLFLLGLFLLGLFLILLGLFLLGLFLLGGSRFLGFFVLLAAAD